MSFTGPECIWKLDAELGEGPVWSAAERALWFVDIKGSRIHRYHAQTGEKKSWNAPAQPGFLAPLAGGGFVVGLKTGLHRFDPATGVFSLLHEIEPHLPGNRLNDGAVDPLGRLWFGSMDDGEAAPSGQLHRLDAGGPRAMEGGIAITNGPAFSPDGGILYHTDTLKRTIHAFDVGKDGSLSNKRLFVTIDAKDGFPDGSTGDSEGCVWVGLWGGWCARRYSPKGEIVSTVRFPCANVTKIAFGGDDLRTVYATTAWKGLSAADRADQPLAGGLFRFEGDVAGQKQAEVSLD